MWPQTTADLAPVWCDISTRQSLSESPRRLCASTADSTRSRPARRSQCPGPRNSGRSWSISRSTCAFRSCRCRFNTSFKGIGTTSSRTSGATPRRAMPSRLPPQLPLAQHHQPRLRRLLHPHPARLPPPQRPIRPIPLRLRPHPHPQPLLPPHGPRLPRAPPQPPSRLLRPLPHRLPLPHRALGLLGQHPRRLRPRAAGAGPFLAERQAHGGDGGAESLGGRGVRARVLCVLWLRRRGAQALPDGVLGGRQAGGVRAARGRRLPIPIHRPSPVGQARADDGQRGEGAPDRAAAHPREAAPRVAVPLPRRHPHRRRHGLRAREGQRGLRAPHALH